MRRAWEYDCAIIGAGPGGLVSALYLARFGRKVALIGWGKPRAAWIPRTHNLIGYDRGISGALLLTRLHRQLARVAADPFSQVDEFRAEARLERYHAGFRVKLGEHESLTASKAILATGIDDIHPELANLVELRRLGLLRYCSICDGFEYRNQPVAVFAQDAAGLEKALFVSRWTRKIHLILPETFNPGKRRFKQLEKACLEILPCRILKAAPCTVRDRPALRLTINGGRTLTVRAAYVELGCRVRDSAFRHLAGLNRTKAGFITTTTEQRTSIPGLFAVGDCVNLLGQISVAAGQAAVAATTLHNDLL